MYNNHTLPGKLSWKSRGRSVAAVHPVCPLCRITFLLWCNSAFPPDTSFTPKQNLALCLHRVGSGGTLGLTHVCSENHVWSSWAPLLLWANTKKNIGTFLVCSSFHSAEVPPFPQPQCSCLKFSSLPLGLWSKFKVKSAFHFSAFPHASLPPLPLFPVIYFLLR